MPDAPADNRVLLRRTLIAVGAMVGACVVAVGTLTLVAVSVVEHTIGVSSADSAPAAAASSPGPGPSLPARPPRGRWMPQAASNRTAEPSQSPR